MLINLNDFSSRSNEDNFAVTAFLGGGPFLIVANSAKRAAICSMYK